MGQSHLVWPTGSADSHSGGAVAHLGIGSGLAIRRSVHSDNPDRLFARLSLKLDEAMKLAQEADKLPESTVARRSRAHALAVFDSARLFIHSELLTDIERRDFVEKLRQAADVILTSK